jgi:hypothetical protein
MEDGGWRMEDRKDSAILDPPSSILHPRFFAYGVLTKPREICRLSYRSYFNTTAGWEHY